MTMPVIHMLDQGGLAQQKPEVAHVDFNQPPQQDPLALITKHFRRTIPFSDASVNIANNKEWEAHTTNIEDTLEHQRRVADLALKLSYYIPSMSERERSVLFCAAAFHDVGKFELNPRVIFKEDDLQDEEYEYVKTHSQLSSDIINRMTVADLNERIRLHNKTAKNPVSPLPDEEGIVAQVADLALEHQEHSDGAGYPHGLKGDEISPHGRLLVVADVFDALTNPRCYRKNGKVFTAKDALTKLQNYAGIKFDDYAVMALSHMVWTSAQPAGAKPLATEQSRWSYKPSRPLPKGAQRQTSLLWVLQPR